MRETQRTHFEQGPFTLANDKQRTTIFCKMYSLLHVTCHYENCLNNYWTHNKVHFMVRLFALIKNGTGLCQAFINWHVLLD